MTPNVSIAWLTVPTHIRFPKVTSIDYFVLTPLSVLVAVWAFKIWLIYICVDHLLTLSDMAVKLKLGAVRREFHPLVYRAISVTL